MNPEQVRAALVGIEQQARQYLAAKREGRPRLHGYAPEALNPRWLILLDNGNVQSSQVWDINPPAAIRFRIPVPTRYVEQATVDYFRDLKHAYLDKFHGDTIPTKAGAAKRAAFGLPELHPVALPAFAADIARAEDPANPEPPKPKAPKREREGRAARKDEQLARAIAQRTGGRVSAEMLLSSGTARTLRRAQMTLHRWAELECGTDAGHVEREGDDGTGRPYFVPDWRGRGPGGVVRHAIPDREAGALRRVAAACKALGLHYFHQTDPRGCALYVDAQPLTDQNYPHGVTCL